MYQFPGVRRQENKLNHRLVCRSMQMCCFVGGLFIISFIFFVFILQIACCFCRPFTWR